MRSRSSLPISLAALAEALFLLLSTQSSGSRPALFLTASHSSAAAQPSSTSTTGNALACAATCSAVSPAGPQGRRPLSVSTAEAFASSSSRTVAAAPLAEASSSSGLPLMSVSTAEISRSCSIRCRRPSLRPRASSSVSSRSASCRLKSCVRSTRCLKVSLVKKVDASFCAAASFCSCGALASTSSATMVAHTLSRPCVRSQWSTCAALSADTSVHASSSAKIGLLKACLKA